MWSSKSGVVGNSLGDELYDEHVGSAICNATNLVDAVAQFWQATTDLIERNTDDVFPFGWTRPISDTRSVAFLVFPNCPELYSYSTAFTVIAALEFCKPLCRHLGAHLSLTVFHPKFKNSPKLLSPERHSPFPVIGLQLETPTGLVTNKPPEPPVKRQRGNTKQERPNIHDIPDEDESPLVSSKIRDLDQQRDILEVLFNSAAVAGSESESVASIGDYYHGMSEDDEVEDPVDEEEALTRTFQKEKEMRTRNIPDDKVKEISMKWIAENKMVDNSWPPKENNALVYADSISDDRWVISNHKMAEMVYRDIWQAIRGLYELGLAEEANPKLTATSKDRKAVDSSKETDDSAANSMLEFMKALGGGSSKRSKRSNKVDDKPNVLSTMFVATKFNAFNAQSFKRFAITINAALKRLTNSKMFLEVFHNEYIGQSGSNNMLRRSPFPMIQICFKVEAPRATSGSV